MKPPDMHYGDPKVATIMARELSDREDMVTDDYHVVDHAFYGWVIAQVFNKDGEIAALPGSSRAWRQYPDHHRGTVLVDRMNPTLYPLTVVITGCESYPDLSSE